MRSFNKITMIPQITHIFTNKFKNIKIHNSISENATDFLVLKLSKIERGYLLEFIDIDYYCYDDFDVIINIEALEEYLTYKKFSRSLTIFITQSTSNKRLYGIVINKHKKYQYTVSACRRKLSDNVNYIETINGDVIFINNRDFFFYGDDCEDDYDYYKFLQDKRNYSLFKSDIANMFTK